MKVVALASKVAEEEVVSKTSTKKVEKAWMSCKEAWMSCKVALMSCKVTATDRTFILPFAIICTLFIFQALSG